MSDDFESQVAAKAARKLRAQRAGPHTVWFGLGMSGLIGWSVAVPAVLGASLGMWWDHRHPGPHSWTLAGLAAGVILGCVNAWHWVSRENRAMDDHIDDHE